MYLTAGLWGGGMAGRGCANCINPQRSIKQKGQLRPQLKEMSGLIYCKNGYIIKFMHII